MSTPRLGLARLAPALALALAAPLAATTFYDLDPANDDVLTAPAVPLGVDRALTVQGALTAGDVDFYPVPLDTGQVLSASVVGIGGLPAALDSPYVRLGVLGEAPNTEVRVENTDAASDNLTGIGGAGVRYTASSTSIVYVVVTGMDDSAYDGSHTEDGPYALVVSRTAARPSPAGDSDPMNDQPAGADPLALAAGSAVTLHGMLRSGAWSDVDLFAVQLAAGDVLVAETAALGDDFAVPDTRLGILTSDGTVQVTNDDSGSHPPGLGDHSSRVRFQAVLPGVYFVGVVFYEDTYFEGYYVGSDQTDNAGDYVLTVSRTAGDAPTGLDSDPANDVRAGADALTLGAGGATVAVGELLSGGAASDVDYFSIALSAGDILTANVVGLEPGLTAPDTRLALLDAGGLLLVENLDGYEADPVLRARAGAAGTYYLAIASNDDATYDGSGTISGRYALTVGVQPDPPPGPVTLDSDPTNDLRAGADPAPFDAGGALLRAELLTGFDVDFYSVTLGAGQLLTVMTTPLGGAMSVPDTRVGVFDDQGTVLVENDDNGSTFPAGPDAGSLTRFYATAAGAYWVAIANHEDLPYDGSGGDEPGAYALTLAVADPNLLFADGFETGGVDRWGPPAP